MTIQKEETKISVITNGPLKRKGLRINLRILNKTLFGLIILAGFFYITGVNSLTVMGFKVREMKSKVVGINNENQALETEITALSSYSGLGEKVKTLGMVKADRINYIEAQGGFVAKK